MDNHQELPESKIYLPVFISWEQAQVLARQYLVGMEFNVSQFALKVMDISVREQAGQVFLQLHTSGTYDGEIITTFNPVLYKERNKIEFENFKLKMDTGNFFQKGMVILLRGAIEKQLEKALDFTLDQPIDQMLTMVNQQLTAFIATPQLKIQGKIERMELLDFSYSPLGIQIKVSAEGRLSFSVDSFQVT